MICQKRSLLRRSFRLIYLLVLTVTLLPGIASGQESGAGKPSQDGVENKATENKPKHPKARKTKGKGMIEVKRELIILGEPTLVGPPPKEDLELTILLYPCKGETPGNVLGISEESPLPDRVTGFRKKLDEADLKTRACAARQLGYLGPQAKDAVPQLIKLTHDEGDTPVFRHIEFALWSIGPGRPLPTLKDSKANLAELVELSKAEDVYVRLYAVFTLGYYRPVTDQKVIVAALVDKIQDHDGVVRWMALSGLSRLGPIARDAVPVLIDLLQDDDKALQKPATIALGGIGPDAAAAVPALLKQLYGADSDLSLVAAMSLGRIGPVILPLLEKEVETHPFKILEVVGNLGPSGVPVVIKALRMPDKDVRKEAINVAWAMGNAAEPIVPLLADALKDREQRIRSAAADALGHLGPVSRAAVPALTAALKNKPSWVQCSVANSLGSIGPDAKSAAPALLRLMKAPLTGITDVPQRCAAGALMKISAETKALVPADMVKRVEDWQANLSSLLPELFEEDATRPKAKPKPKQTPEEIH